LNKATKAPASPKVPTIKSRILAEGAWVTFGQAGSALGTLIGIRLLTEFLPPGVFGAVSLLIGVVALGVGTIGTPLMQATLRFYPDLVARNEVHTLRHTIVCRLRRTGFLSIAVLLLGYVAYSLVQNASVWVAFLLTGLFVADIARQLETTLFNAARRQQPFALWAVAEAWARPLLAVVFVVLLGATTFSVLFGYLAGSLGILLVVFYTVNREGIVPNDVTIQSSKELERTVWQYALPIVPLALIGWTSGLGDRYIIGAMLGLEEVGVYSAVYGLVSRPFLMIGRIVELTLRPFYHNAVSANNHKLSRETFNTWLKFLLPACLVSFMVVLLWHKCIATLFLGERYRSGANLMPWIAFGHCLLVLSHAFARVCYAQGKTRLVLLVELSGSICSIGLGIFAIYFWGLIGAAVAVPVYFGIQLGASIIAAGISEKDLRQQIK